MAPARNPGMDEDIFEQFAEQLQRYVRERLIPAEKEILETDIIPDSIMAEMRDMGLFGLTMPEEYGGSGMNIQQYVRTIREMSYAMPCYRSITSINIGMICSAFKNGGTDAQMDELFAVLQNSAGARESRFAEDGWHCFLERCLYHRKIAFEC